MAALRSETGEQVHPMYRQLLDLVKLHKLREKIWLNESSRKQRSVTI